MPISLRLVGPGKYHESYIEHLPDRYLVIRGHQISCEPLKTEDVDDFVYRLTSYPALIEKEPPVIAQTFSHQHQSKKGLRVYMCAKDENNISLQEMASPHPLPKDDLIFFISHARPRGLVCFESTRYPKRFLAVDEEDQVCLKRFNDESEADDPSMVQFKITFVH